jgi:hypothetical protein
MRIPKRLIIPGAVVAAGMSGLVGVSAVNAASTGSGQDNLVDKIASTFHLSKADVQKVFDQNHQDKEAAHQQKFETKVKQAVKDGKITQDLADQLVAKQKELATYRDSLKDKKPSERMAAVKTKMDEFVKWAEANNISKDLLPMGPRIDAQMPNDSSTQSQ